MVDPVLPSSGLLSPLGLESVRLAPGFWGDRLALDREVIIDHCLEWMEKEGWIANFTGEQPRRGREFSDSEIYKLLEGMAWAGHPGFEELAAVVVQAQEADGYLNTRWSGDRYRDLEWGHELYCYGHLLQAGVARLRTHGEDDFTALVRRAADHVCEVFVEGTRTDGHPCLEMALVELYRSTGAERYLELARRLVERRGLPALGTIPFGPAYFQDDIPVRQARVLRGHAVRALYLASGAVDVAVETGDAELLAAVEAQWERTVARRTHLTGGMGSRHADEAFGDDFELPPDRAYAETCAGIASIMLSHRLLLATGRARYADLAERTMYNVLATAVALDGHSFFYSNPLQVRVAAPAADGMVSHAAAASLRSAWFDVSCCPSNISRTLASLPAYVATTDAGGVQVHHYTPAEVRGAGMALRVETGYPWSGGVRVRVLEGGEGAVSLRVPAWARDAGYSVHRPDDGSPGAAGAAGGQAGPGYLTLPGPWRPGDEIHLDLPTTPRWTRPDHRADALRGTVAVERGPLVYCAESPGDLPPLADIAVRQAPPAEHEADGVVELEVEAGLVTPAPDGWPYDGSPGSPAAGGSTTLRLIPYHRWGNRGPATMRIWLPAD
ncbi:glycoside hydrolase family 127 protein [Nonomuraea sp. NPDC050663]|uniref:glycoside hydrolase family 127 protein n=1 Tax=Nonomuraea sp. NPDC050663 TaxID=3364370 RepID=UPI0037A33F77